MRFILSFILISVFSFAAQTCQKAATTAKPDIAKADTAKPDTAKTNTNSAVKTVEPEHQDDAPRISLADAKKDFDAGKAIFVDTRSADAYKLEHVKGAINVSLNDFEARYKEIPTTRKIIVYCS